jgi:hypothetical protein
MPSTSINEKVKLIFGILSPLSFYSPAIILAGMLMFSIFSSSYGKIISYYLWIFIITGLRILFLMLKSYLDNRSGQARITEPLPQICSNGVTSFFIPEDVTYSTYILSFTMAYLLTPLILVSKETNMNVMNYVVLAFFIAYILFDWLIKYSFLCIRNFVPVILGDCFAGITLGIAITVFMYSYLRNWLYINDLNSDKEVCSMPSKQQFRCTVRKNGEIVSSSIN